MVPPNSALPSQVFCGIVRSAPYVNSRSKGRQRHEVLASGWVGRPSDMAHAGFPPYSDLVVQQKFSGVGLKHATSFHTASRIAIEHLA